MCGILALFTQGSLNKLYNYDFLKSLELLDARGPDDSEYLVMGKNQYGFTRLSINDTTKNGMQPFTDDKDGVLLCNGEIYNHKELEQKYDIKVGNTSSDCACLLPLYRKIGFENMICEIDGVFAIILYDNNKVYIGRDRIGVRPLFMCKKDNVILFSSEAKCLDNFSSSIDQVVPGFMSFNVNSEYIPYPTPIPYKKIPIEIEDMNNIFDNIRNILTKAVKKRLLSDRPIGCLLSGGLDSSIIASLLCKLLGNENVRTYSIGMTGSPDLKNAKVVADFLGTKHSEVKFTSEEGISAINDVIYTIESTDITTVRASVPMYLLSQYINKNTDDKVIFSGEGADELLCGYLYFHKAPSPKHLEEESVRLINNLRYYDVLRSDRCVSGSGLEIRVPFLDKEFVDYCINLPGEIKGPIFKMEKYILRKAFEDYLPASIIWRRKDGLSDGVSDFQKPWYSYIQEYAEHEVEYDPSKFISEEAQYYNEVFENNFNNFRPNISYWMHKWVETNNPSNREIDI